MGPDLGKQVRDQDAAKLTFGSEGGENNIERKK